MTSISFDLLSSIRETQLQNGLRSDDFTKYHAYCTTRIKTLRKQLKLSNAHKIVSTSRKRKHSSSAHASSGKNNKNNNNVASNSNSNDNKNRPRSKTPRAPRPGTYVAPTQVTENNCKDPRSITLLALIVERCWAESEELRLAKTGPSDSMLMQRHQSNTKMLMKHSRARLSRAVQMTKRLVEVVDKVGDEDLKNQTHAYTESIHGRFAFTSGDFATAKKHFLEARKRYHELAVALTKTIIAASSVTDNNTNTTNTTTSAKSATGKGEATPQQKHALAIDLRTECDDRIVTCMRSLGEDASSYKPSTEGSTSSSSSGGATSGNASSSSSSGSLTWLGRAVPISNFQVQNALRRFDALDVFTNASNLLECAAAVEDTNGTDGMAWWIFQQQSAFNKMQDGFDRAVGALNDAQDAVTADLANHAKTTKASDEVIIDQLRLTQHCLKFRTLMCVVTRAFLASWSLGARFLLSTELLNTKKGGKSSSSSSSSSRLPPKRLINLPAKVTTSYPSAATASKELAFTLQHVVSPLDVVRLFDIVINSVDEALLLPGVDGEDVVEVVKEVIRSDRLFFVAAGWQVVSSASSAASSSDDSEGESALTRCVSALTHSEKILNAIEKKHPENGKAGSDWKENFGFTCPVLAGFTRSLLVRRAAAARTGAAALTSAPELAASSTSANIAPSVVDASHKAASSVDISTRIKKEKASPSSAAAKNAASSSNHHIASDKLQEFVTCSAFTQFPPDFQSAPCKPAFVDIAGTYAEDYLGVDDSDDDEGSATTTKQPAPKKQQTAAAATHNNNNKNGEQQPAQTGGGGWLGWLRGS